MLTPSEKFVAELCEKSFLPFWSFPNPMQKKDKELCDLLVICENDVIIISVKDIKLSSHSDEEVRSQRWQRAAIQDSVRQIYGAERFLSLVDTVELKDKSFKVTVPPKDNRNIYRIAIAFGSENQFPLETGDFGKGFVHVFDEESTFTVLSEMDTIRDFINYLKAKENFLSNRMILVPKEVDFLALYINTELIFDNDVDFVGVDSGLWEAYAKSEEYKRWVDTIQDSYMLDEIVSQLHKSHVVGNEGREIRNDLEKATRLITQETRMNRREIALIIRDAISKKLSGRMMKPLPGTQHSYVIMPLSQKNWKGKESELQLRCMIARYDIPEARQIIGLGIGKDPDGVPVFDLAYFDIPQLTDEVKIRVKEAKEELGFFKNPQTSRSSQMR